MHTRTRTYVDACAHSASHFVTHICTHKSSVRLYNYSSTVQYGAFGAFGGKLVIRDRPALALTSKPKAKHEAFESVRYFII